MSEVYLKIQIALMAFAFWFCISVLASHEKARKESCGKNYPIDYFFFTNLFCEIKEAK